MADDMQAEQDDERLFQGDDPFALFARWFEAAKAQEINDPNAMALATADADGLPDCRMVLLKGFDERGFVFYTNTRSAKGRELAQHPKAGLLFHWKSLRRQVRVRGPVEAVSLEESDAYFASRPRGSQVGAWASDQSQTLENRGVLEAKVAAYDAQFGDAPPPRPPHWSGYRVIPSQMEFWRDRRSRLHERYVFERTARDAPWSHRMLYP
jgi:pyridoxamine 5'-phosphate oxidase